MDASYARAIAWPPGSDLKPDASVGEQIYARHCAVCHGPDGRGNGPAAPALHPRPRDFTSGAFKLSSTPSGQPPTIEDLRQVILHGMPGSSMPAWDDVLTSADVDAVAEYVRSFGPHREWGVAPTIKRAPLADTSPAHGSELYQSLGCPACHGPEGRGDGSSAKELKDNWKQPDPPRDLTAPWTFRGGAGDDALVARIANGMSGTPMPGYNEVAEPGDIAAVVSFIHSIARTPPWQPGGSFDGPGQSSDPIKRGEYLVRAEMCELCHTPVDDNGIYLADTHYLAGGMRIGAGAHGVFFSRNLTPDDATGLGTWSIDQIATAIRTGQTPERRLNFWGMPWMVFHAFTTDDALAIASYLKTLHPVHNRIPLPLHYGTIETVARKALYPWPALTPQRLTYAAGNFGEEQPGATRRELPQNVLVWTQLVVLLAGVVAAACARGGSLARSTIGAATTLVLLGVALVVERYPALSVVPAEVIAAGFAANIPEPRLDGRPPHEAALLRRGHYLYRVASCAFCHNGDGSGGSKISWSAMGTTWARNLTADPTGLRDWSDKAILRAIVSGVGHDSAALHWQAMIWDHASNFSIEDQRALLAYLRGLPPVSNSIPPAQPPSARDCAVYSFWVRDGNMTPGCE